MRKALTAILPLAAALTPFIAEALPLGCLPSPLPATPIPPTYSLEFHFFDDRALGTIWRQACTDGSGEVAVLIRLTGRRAGRLWGRPA